VQSHTFNGFAIYRVLLGGALLFALSTHALPEMGKPETKPISRTAQKESVPTFAPAAATTTNTDSTTTPANASVSTNPAPANVPAAQ
jgi:hypothetical protein